MILHCETAGVRLDVFLTQALEGMTRSAAQRLLEGNHVKKDGQPVKKNQKTEAGADYTVEIPEAQPIALQPEKIDLDIAYEDSDVVIINKPKGNGRAPCGRALVGDAGQCTAVPLWRFSLRDQRPTAPRHCAPDRQGHLRLAAGSKK